MDLQKLAEMKIIKHERLYIINKGRSDEAKVVASDVKEACDVYRASKDLPIVSVKEEDKVISFAI